MAQQCGTGKSGASPLSAYVPNLSPSNAKLSTRNARRETPHPGALQREFQGLQREFKTLPCLDPIIDTESRGTRALPSRSIPVRPCLLTRMPSATNEPPSHDPDADGLDSDEQNRDAEDEGPDPDRTPLADPVRTARLALQAMLGPGTTTPDDEDSPPDSS